MKQKKNRQRILERVRQHEREKEYNKEKQRKRKRKKEKEINRQAVEREDSSRPGVESLIQKYLSGPQVVQDGFKVPG